MSDSSTTNTSLAKNPGSSISEGSDFGAASDGPVAEGRFHAYVSNEIPWYVRGLWLFFWIFTVYYSATYLFPAMQSDPDLFPKVKASASASVGSEEAETAETAEADESDADESDE